MLRMLHYITFALFKHNSHIHTRKLDVSKISNFLEQKNKTKSTSTAVMSFCAEAVCSKTVIFLKQSKTLTLNDIYHVAKINIRL